MSTLDEVERAAAQIAAAHAALRALLIQARRGEGESFSAIAERLRPFRGDYRVPGTRAGVRSALGTEEASRATGPA